MKTITVRADVEIETTMHASLDEAMAEALSDAPDGAIVEVHDEKCDVDDVGEGCTCEPLELVTGATS